MTQTRSVVRRRRSTPTIGVTGAAGPLGRALVERLAGHPASPRLVAIDTVREQTPGVTWRLADVRDPDPRRAGSTGSRPSCTWLPTARRPRPTEDRRAVNVRGTEVLLEAAVAAGVQRVVLLTSAMVYGAHPANPVPLPEDTPHLTEPPDGLVGDWVAMENAVRRTADRASLELIVGAARVAGRCRRRTRCCRGCSKRCGCSAFATRAVTGSSATSMTWSTPWWRPRSVRWPARSPSAATGG